MHGVFFVGFLVIGAFQFFAIWDALGVGPHSPSNALISLSRP